MTRDQALQKIRKCLALAKSPNPNEASIAMRQAQALMAQHGLNPTDVELSDVTTATCSTRTNSQPAWEVLLASLIARAFGCDTVWTKTSRWLASRKTHVCEVVFIGIGSAPQIAGYAWDVLSRRCAKARLMYLRQLSARCKPITRTARGDEFARYWVAGVTANVEDFANTPRNVQLIAQFKAMTWPDAESFEPKNRAKGRNVRFNDRHEGYRAGQDARLERGIDGMAERRLLA